MNRPRGRRLVAALGLGSAAGAVVVIVVVTTGSPTRVPSASAAARVSGATTVQRRDLVATDTQSGTLSYAGKAPVYNRLSGTITWLPRVGQLVKPGQPLFDVNNRPVVLLDGTTPAYRDLTPSDSAGPDIEQLNRNLVALGFNPDGIVVDNVWQAATTAGVERFQASLGESQTGSLALGTIVFAPGPRLIASVKATVGSTGGGGSAPTSAVDHPAAPATEFVSLTQPKATPSHPSTTTTPPRTPTRPPARRPSTPPGRTPSPSGSNAQLQAIIALLQAEIAQLRNSHANPPASPSSNHPSSHTPSGSTPSGSTPSGSSGGNAVEVLDTTSDHLVVTVNLPAASQGEATVGEKVGVQTPSGASMTGVITAVSPVAQSSSDQGGGGGGGGSGGTQTVPVTIRVLGRLGGAGLDQATVSVSFAQARARNVLSVPVTALLATSGTTYAVQEAAPPHRLIPVTVGLFAAGYAQISGAGLYPGLQVTDSQG
jgi:hypothetical protein